jgi:molybdenum cofactor cytidylyltransferase
MGVLAAENLIRAIPQSIAVVRADDVQLAAGLSALGFRIVVNEQAQLGIGSSVSCAVRMSPEAQGWVIALGDMPFIPSDIHRRVAQLLEEGAPLAAPAFQGQRGHPVGFAKAFEHELLNLHSDQGAKSILSRNSSSLRLVQVEEQGILLDIDTTIQLRYKKGYVKSRE